MALITVDDIVALIGDSTIDSDDETILQMYLDFAQGELEAWLGRPVTVESFTEIAVADVDGRVYLPNTPVVSVTSVTINDEVQDTDFYTVVPWGIEFSFVNAPMTTTLELESSYAYDGLNEPEITVVYTAGLDAPNVVNSALAAVVIRQWNERRSLMAKDAADALGVKEMRVEDYSVEYHPDSTSGNTNYSAGANPITLFRHDADFNSVKRYKRRAVA